MQPADSPVKLKKNKLTTRSDLSSSEKEVMIEWLKEHPILYNKKLSSYKDKAKKDSLWNEQAVLLEKDVSILHVWYRSIRTRFGKLAKLKSGSGSGERTECDLWVLENFKFFKSHIHGVQPRTVVSVSTTFFSNLHLHLNF
ncbi:hypothetical protein DPMN_030846 [Dreissena polymorpha]|uniref:MADF domain-containing protein n=1 Tax=Dreissena polymorpha TaxID=45954 RepID=A0A9D4LZS7_DREPO|nr:hypothetical protein DPMN_030846 [Dreissena polymorpha]